MKKHHVLSLLQGIVFGSTIFSSHAAVAASKVQQDEDYMQVAIEHARHNPQAPFAALIVDQTTGKIVGKGLNNSRANPTLHGEIDAINDAVKNNPKIDWHHMTLYTTAEPCSMCQSAVIWAGIPRVVFGTSMEFLLKNGWDQIEMTSVDMNSHAPFYKGTVTGGVLAQKTDALFVRKLSMQHHG